MPEPLKTYESKGTASSRSDVPAGVRFSAIILVLLACALGVCGIFCVIAVAIILTHHGPALVGVSFGLGAAIAVAASLIGLRGAKALRNAQRWGANVATVCGGLAVVFGGLVILDFFHAGRQSADAYFLYPVAPIFLVLGIWLCIYLNMPQVRSGFARRLG
jgi:hypothetical protein